MIKKKIFWILVFVLFLRVAFVLITDKSSILEPGSDPYFYNEIAKGILAGEGYHQGNLYAYMPPLYPFFLAGIYGVFSHSLLAVQFIQSLISTVTCIFIYLIAQKLFNRRIALISAFLYAIDPQLAAYPTLILSETLFIFFYYLGLLFLIDRNRQNPVRWEMATGLLIGLSALTREIGLNLLFVIGIWFFLYRKELKTTFLNLGRIALAAMVVIASWTIRNYSIFHRIIPISTNGSVNFYIGNNPEADGTFTWRLPRGTIWNKKSPNGLYEIDCYKNGFKEGLKYIYDNPKKSVILAITKLFLLWEPPYHWLFKEMSIKERLYEIFWLLSYSVLLIGGTIGLVLTGIKQWRKFSLLYVFLILPTLISMITFSNSRFRLPMIPVLIVLSAFSFSKFEEILERFFIKKRQKG